MRTALLLLVAAIAVTAPTALADGQRAGHDCVRGNEVWFDDGGPGSARRPSLRRPPARRATGRRAGAPVERQPVRVAAGGAAACRTRHLGLRLRLPRARLLEGTRQLRPARDRLCRRGQGRAVARSEERRDRGRVARRDRRGRRGRFHPDPRSRASRRSRRRPRSRVAWTPGRSRRASRSRRSSSRPAAIRVRRTTSQPTRKVSSARQARRRSTSSSSRGPTMASLSSRDRRRFAPCSSASCAIRLPPSAADPPASACST